MEVFKIKFLSLSLSPPRSPHPPPRCWRVDPRGAGRRRDGHCRKRSGVASTCPEGGSQRLTLAPRGCSPRDGSHGVATISTHPHTPCRPPPLFHFAKHHQKYKKRVKGSNPISQQRFTFVNYNFVGVVFTPMGCHTKCLKSVFFFQMVNSNQSEHKSLLLTIQRTYSPID